MSFLFMHLSTSSLKHYKTKYYTFCSTKVIAPNMMFCYILLNYPAAYASIAEMINVT